MAVYREGFIAVETIQQASVQIYPDAADVGALCNKGDKIWNLTQQLIEWYKKDDTQVERHNYSTGQSCKATVELIDEWGYSDDESPNKSSEKYTRRYMVEYTGVKKRINYNGKKYDGFVHVYLIK